MGSCSILVYISLLSLFHQADEVDHQRDLYCLDTAESHTYSTRQVETLGAHLLTMQGGERSCAPLQQLWEIRGQTLLDGECDMHMCRGTLEVGEDCDALFSRAHRMLKMRGEWGWTEGWRGEGMRKSYPLRAQINQSHCCAKSGRASYVA